MIKVLNHMVNDIPSEMIPDPISLTFFDQELTCVCFFEDGEKNTVIEKAVGAAFVKIGTISVIPWIYVKPDRRDQGIGRALAEYTELYISKKGCKQCIISIAGTNYELIGITGFIERLDYELVPVDIRRVTWLIPETKEKMSADWVKDTRAKRPESISLADYKKKNGSKATEEFLETFEKEIGTINLDNIQPTYSRMITAGDKVLAAMLVTVENHSYMLSKLYMDSRAEGSRLDLLCTLFVDVINSINVLEDFQADKRIVEASKRAFMDIRYDDRYDALVSQFGYPYDVIHIWEYMKYL